MQPVWHKILHDVLIAITGDVPLGTYLGCMFWAIVAATMVLFYGAAKRDPLKDGTPVKFHHRFLLLDNWKRMLLSLGLIMVALRFCPELFSMPLTPYSGFAIGVSLDSISQYIFQKPRKAIEEGGEKPA